MATPEGFEPISHEAIPTQPVTVGEPGDEPFIPDITVRVCELSWSGPEIVSERTARITVHDMALLNGFRLEQGLPPVTREDLLGQNIPVGESRHRNVFQKILGL